MKTIKKYTAIMILEISQERHEVGDYYTPTLSFGQVRGAFYSKEYPEKEFDTEDQAIEFAYKENKYVNWMIIPIIKFEE